MLNNSRIHVSYRLTVADTYTRQRKSTYRYALFNQ